MSYSRPVLVSIAIWILIACVYGQDGNVTLRPSTTPRTTSTSAPSSSSTPGQDQSEQADGRELSFPGFKLPSLPALPNIFPPAPCVGPTDQLSGFCRSSRDCAAVGGVPDGDCALGLGTCCLNVFKCGTKSLVNNTYFVNNESPNATLSSGSCALTIFKLPNVVQIKLELTIFEVTGVDGAGRCSADSLTVDGLNPDFTFPSVCGTNNGQHLYLPIDQGSKLDFDVKVSMSGEGRPRKWQIKVIQLERGNPSLAPFGCLQYYSGLSGQFSSLNFRALEAKSNIGDLRYAACFRQQTSYCSIAFHPSGARSQRSLYRFGYDGYSRTRSSPNYNANSYRPQTRPVQSSYGLSQHIVAPQIQALYNPSYGKKPTAYKVPYQAPYAAYWNPNGAPTSHPRRPSGYRLPLRPQPLGSGVTSEPEEVTIAPVDPATHMRPNVSAPCQGEDTLVFPPSTSNSGSTVMCDRTGGFPVTVNMSPFIVYVNNRGPSHGRGFRFNFNHLVC